MASNLDLDDELVEAAQQLGCHKTKKAAVNAALEEYVRALRLKEFLALMKEGGIDYDEDYDPVAERKKWAEQLERRYARWDE
jgi:Arc/MetJ family transcription regulator